MPLTLAFLGYGEVGQLFARQLKAGGAELAVHDVKALGDVAARDGLRFARALGEAVAGADIVVSAVTADQAEPVARAAAPHLRAGQIYIDLNSVSPNTKRAVASALGDVDFVEFAVMAPVAEVGIAAPILAGGARAQDVAGRLNPLGMKIDVVSAEIGVASSTKLCRSLVIKGLEAIMIDLARAAPRAGVSAGVLASLTASYPGMPWADIMAYMPPRVARHGKRRAAEMREAATMLEELGLSGAFARAIADAHETYAGS